MAHERGLGVMLDPSERAQHYRERAARIRGMAETEPHAKSREDLLTLADQYDRLVVELLRQMRPTLRKRPDFKR